MSGGGLAAFDTWRGRRWSGSDRWVKDAQWLCQLLEAGLLHGSFVPPKPIRQLRNFTRCRAAQISERQREANRVHKALENTGIKLDCVATDILGVSRPGDARRALHRHNRP
jgi:Transposase